MRPKKKLSHQEYEFARALAQGEGSIQAARRVLHWRCETEVEKQAARDLARSPRVAEATKEIKDKLEKEAQAQQIVELSSDVTTDSLRKFAEERLETIRDDRNVPSATRFQAINALEKLYDPSSDFVLVMRWVDLLWRFARAHCPSCHDTFPLHMIKNERLDEWREEIKSPPESHPTEIFDCRMEFIKRADKRKRPHPGQIICLSSEERHEIITAPARSGKSYCLALFAAMGLMLPGVEIWLIARIYEDAGPEIEYLKQFIKSIFHPYERHVIKTLEDKKNGEIHIYTKWDSILKVKSAKAKGSMIGKELELALIAEPGWLDDSVYEEVRARMSSRLGRIIAMGTPKGTGGFIGRMVRMTGRDPVTGKIMRWTPEDRLLENGCPWVSSMLIYNINPADNPEYVEADRIAARMELTDEEYASEFEGEMVSDSGLKFYGITDKNLITLPRQFYQDAVFIMGIDQGPVNFGGCLIAYNGKRIVPCFEFFDSSETTMQSNLEYLKDRVPAWIRILGGKPERWLLTAIDRDPQLWGIFADMDSKGNKWPTEITERYENKRKLNENWRRTLSEFINVVSKTKLDDGLPQLVFQNSEFARHLDDRESAGAVLLHDELMRALDKPDDRARESGRLLSDKGWTIHSAFRKDHVADGFMLAMWNIYSGQLIVPMLDPEPHSPFEEAERSLRYQRARQEQIEMSGFTEKQNKSDSQLFEEYFGRKKPQGGFFGQPIHSGYSDES